MIAYRRAVAAVDGLHGRTVTVRLVAWDTPAEVTDNGRDYYLESFARGGLDATDDAGRLLARFEHDGPLVGQIVRDSLDNRADGLYADVSLRDTAAARDLLALLDDQLDDGAIVDAVSVEFDDDPVPAGTPAVHRTRARLTGVAFTPEPQHHTARVLAVRSEGNHDMTRNRSTGTAADDLVADAEVEVDDAVDNDNDNDAAGDDDVVDDAAPPARQPAAVTRSVRRPGGNAGRPAGFESFADYIVAAYHGTAPAHVAGEFHRAFTQPARYRRAWAGNSTADAAGVVRDAWLAEIIDLVATLTPTVEAFANRPLPAKGMNTTQPVVTQRPLVGKQTVELADIESRKVTIGLESWPVDTYAGGDQLSLQLIERAEVDVLSEYARLYVQEMAQTLNAAVVTGVLAAADDVNAAVEIVDDPTTGVPDFNRAVIAGSKPILTALRRLPSVALLSVDLWEVLGNAKDTTGRPLYPTISPTNPVGSFDVTSPSGNVRSLSYVVEPELSGTTAVLGVPDSYVVKRSGMKTITADAVMKLGRDVAVYEYASHGVVDATGLVLLTDDVDEVA